MCYFGKVDVGLRELRQQASELVRRVQHGESITVTVSGRPAARLVPVEPPAWRDAHDLDALYAGGVPDHSWPSDLALLEGLIEAGPRDPFAS